MINLLSAVVLASRDPAAIIAERNAANPYATFSVAALSPENVGGCYKPSPVSEASEKLTFTEAELSVAAAGPSIDWRAHGAVGPIQQQHPFGTCWAFSMTAVTEAVRRARRIFDSPKVALDISQLYQRA